MAGGGELGSRADTKTIGRHAPRIRLRSSSYGGQERRIPAPVGLAGVLSFGPIQDHLDNAETASAACQQEAGGESREDLMAKKQNGTGVYRIVDVVGVSKVSWEDAAKRAVETAAQSIRDLRIAEVTKMDLTVENGTVSAFRTRVALSFKYEK
jgi:dodecin